MQCRVVKSAGAIIGVVAAVVLSSSASFAQLSSADGWSEIVEKANEEGTFVWYTNQRPTGIEGLFGEFQDAYPEIRPEFTRLSSSEVIERFSTEFNSGRNFADVVMTFPDDERIFEGIKLGWMTEWYPPELETFGEGLFLDNMLLTTARANEVIIWNQNHVDKAEAPQEWTDLLDPKWKGLVGVNPPWRGIAFQNHLLHLQMDGEENLAERFKKNDVRFFNGSAGLIQAVLRGDVYVAQATDTQVKAMIDDGAPLGYVYPESGTTSIPTVTFISSAAPHPYASMVFLNWFISREGQSAVQEHLGTTSLRSDVPTNALISEEQQAQAVDGTSIRTVEDAERLIDVWRSVFGIQ